MNVSMGINVELLEGSKFDRFTPIVGISVDTNLEKSVDQQIADEIEAVRKGWAKLSDTIESLINEELDRRIKWGKKQ